MKIRKIRLQNVKSYVDQEITFNEGVNFISGINGAGKSTIIEAIGYALFDYSPGTVSEFLRYGTKTGTITVEFCALDEREYRVVRKLGTSSLWSVFDIESDCELDLHGSRDVKAWLKEAFGVGPDLELDQLFRDIVGVPQGTFVSPFLETPSIRKKKFDAILKVEQYRNAFINTRSVVRQMEEAMRDKATKMAVLASEVKDYDGVKEQVLLLGNKVNELEQVCGDINNRLKAKAVTVAELEACKKEIDRISAAEQALTGLLEGLAGRQKDLQANLAQALQARETLTEAAPGYTLYLELEEKLKELELQRRKKEHLEKNLNSARETIASLKGMIEGKEGDIVRREQELATERAEITARLSQIEACFSEQTKQEQRLGQEQQTFLTWLKTEETLGSLYAALQGLHREMVSKLELDRGSLAVEEQELQFRVSILPELRAKSSLLDSKETELRKAREAWAAMKERLDALEKDSLQAADGLCPFLHSPCQNVGGDLKGYFDTKRSEVVKELKVLKEKGLNLASEVSEASGARERVIALEGDLKRLEQVQGSRQKVALELLALAEKVRGLCISEAIKKIEEHVGDLAHPEPDIEEVITGRFTATAVDNTLVEAVDRAAAFIEQVLARSKASRTMGEKSLADRLSESATALAKYSTEKDNLLKALKQGELRTQQLENDKVLLTQNRQKRVVAQETLDRLNKELAEFSGVETAMEEARQSQACYREDYEKYMQNTAGAAKVESLEKEMGLLDREILEKQTHSRELSSKLAGLQSSFDPEVFAREKEELDQLKQSCSVQTQVLQERLQDLQEYREKLKVLTDKLEEMGNLKQEMAGEQKCLKLIEILRGILNGAGAPIAKVYLESLSREANEIYRLISSENAMLEWRSDYDLVMADNFQGRERLRSFKQFSGGEQMTAALAIRLALLKQESMVRIGFFDEPTANLDTGRRMSLAETIPRVTGDFDQLFIISHDDTFDSMTDNIIQLRKDTETGSGLE